ncbi:MAG TPA: 3-oxoacyl-[acyl-carrier-protein] reductase [Parachlamydiaceae bacterium]|nr:3-oxoacyl-[acyl-carrier-protein] reductase [Parachlamydiaceae bacterium]
MLNLLAGKKALVTGATAGLGKAIALKFAEHGADIALIGTNEERGQTVLKEINEKYPNSKAQFYAVDVANHAASNEAVKTILADFGQVDILVNNAGITRDQLLMKMSEEDWDKVLEVNVKSCYNFCYALVRPMMKIKAGRIINVSSVIGLIGNAGQVNYAASKAAIIGFTKALAKELAPRNILVNCIAPGFIETPMTDVLTEEQRKAILEGIPLKRMGTPDDIANAALFMASPLASYITGQVMVVDGGMVM